MGPKKKEKGKKKEEVKVEVTGKSTQHNIVGILRTNSIKFVSFNLNYFKL
jgi:hypothetical protein